MNKVFLQITILALCANFNSKSSWSGISNDSYDQLYYSMPDPVDIFQAISRSNNSFLEFYIKKGQINSKDDDGNTPLIFAIKNNNKKAVEILIKNKVNINEKSIQGNTPLMLSSFLGIKSISNLLIKNKANINLSNVNGTTALMLAAEKNHLEIVKILTELNVNVNQRDNKGYTALTWAIVNNNTEVSFFLINIGADINQKDLNGRSILKKATEEAKSGKIVDFLIKSGVKMEINEETFNKFFNDLMASKLNENNPIRPIVILLKNGLSKRKAINSIKLNLFKAIKENNYNKVKHAISKVTLGVYDNDGNNPLHLAMMAPGIDNENKNKIIDLIFSTRPQLLTQVNKDNVSPLNLMAKSSSSWIYHRINKAKEKAEEKSDCNLM